MSGSGLFTHYSVSGHTEQSAGSEILVAPLAKCTTLLDSNWPVSEGVGRPVQEESELLWTVGMDGGFREG